MTNMSTNLSARMDRLMRGWRDADEEGNRVRQCAIGKAYRRLDAQLRASWDYVTVWTLTIDSDDGVSTQAFLTEDALMTELRLSFDFDDDVADDDLVQAVIDEHGVALYIEEHQVQRGN